MNLVFTMKCPFWIVQSRIMECGDFSVPGNYSYEVLRLCYKILDEILTEKFNPLNTQRLIFRWGFLSICSWPEVTTINCLCEQV